MNLRRYRAFRLARLLVGLSLVAAVVQAIGLAAPAFAAGMDPVGGPLDAGQRRAVWDSVPGWGWVIIGIGFAAAFAAFGWYVTRPNARGR